MNSSYLEQKDEREPNDKRKLELKQFAEKNKIAGRPLYNGITIRNAGELQWIISTNDWSVVLDESTKEEKRINLSGANLSRVNLSNFNLARADLRSAVFRNTNLSNAYLPFVDFRGADLQHAILKDANLSDSNLSSAGPSFSDLRGANLTSVYMDSGTILKGSIVDSQTCWAEVIWNNVLLTGIDWTTANTIGDEATIASATGRQDRVKTLRHVAQAYHGLSVTLRSQGISISASRYRLREEQLERQALRLDRRYIAWFFSVLIDLVAGYGEKPERAVITYILINLFFTLIYYIFGHSTGVFPSLLDSLVFSLTSFHGRGFFPSEKLTLHDPITILAAIEAVIGLFIELIFIATFNRRFLGD